MDELQVAVRRSRHLLHCVVYFEATLGVAHKNHRHLHYVATSSTTEDEVRKNHRRHVEPSGATEAEDEAHKIRHSYEAQSARIVLAPAVAKPVRPSLPAAGTAARGVHLVVEQRWHHERHALLILVSAQLRSV